MNFSTIFPIPAFKDNYIWTWFDERSKTAWVVDPGEAQPVIDVLNKNSMNLAGILLTHHHYDHSGGIEELIRYWENVAVLGSQHSPITAINRCVKEGDEIICAPFRLRVLEIPGHTLDHIAYYNDNILFCGDTLFSAGCGRVFEGTIPQMVASLSKLSHLPDDILIYCGHEYTQANLRFAQQVEVNNPHIATKLVEVNALRAIPKPTLPSILKAEKMFNPFLRCHQSDVIYAVEKKVGRHLNDPIEVFEELRNWKNTF